MSWLSDAFDGIGEGVSSLFGGSGTASISDSVVSDSLFDWGGDAISSPSSWSGWTQDSSGSVLGGVGDWLSDNKGLVGSALQGVGGAISSSMQSADAMDRVNAQNRGAMDLQGLRQQQISDNYKTSGAGLLHKKIEQPAYTGGRYVFDAGTGRYKFTK